MYIAAVMGILGIKAFEKQDGKSVLLDEQRKKLEDRFGIKFEQEEFETLNGFLISKMDRIPREDEQFEVEYQGYNFKVMTVKSNVIQTVLVTRLEEKVI